jgi:Spy/CpxP family protein refolding chaperone
MKNIQLKAGYGLAPILLLLALLFSAPAKAQKMDAAALKKSTPQQRADWQNKMMKDDLKLTDAQYLQVSKLNLEYAQKFQPLFTSNDSRFSKGMKARSLMKEKDGKLQAILTDQQYNNYQKIIKEKTAEVKKAIMDR